MSQVVIRAEGIGKRYRIGGMRTRAWRSDLGFTLRQAWRNARGVSVTDLPERHFWALRDISFEIRAGEVVGFIGPNGAGKSTLLKILARITAPTEGYAELVGRWGALLEVGTGFNQELTGRENIYLSGAILGMSKAEIDRKFDEIVAFSEMEKFLDTPVKRYSSGMGVRLGFAVAAHLEPEILLVDEVLAVGDLAFQQKCLGKMDQVAQQGRTVLFVSHKMTSVKTLCQKVFWLEQGRVRMFGEASEVVNAYEAESFARVMALRSSSQRRFVDQESGIELREVTHHIELNGTGVNLVVQLKGYADNHVHRLRLALTVSTMEGILVSEIQSAHTQAYLNHVDGEWECAFAFPEITRYLNSGEYVIGVIIKRPNLKFKLKAPHAAIVQIPTLHGQGGGKVMQSKRGLVPLPVTFHGGNGAGDPEMWDDEQEL